MWWNLQKLKLLYLKKSAQSQTLQTHYNTLKSSTTLVLKCNLLKMIKLLFIQQQCEQNLTVWPSCCYIMMVMNVLSWTTALTTVVERGQRSVVPSLSVSIVRKLVAWPLPQQFSWKRHVIHIRNKFVNIETLTIPDNKNSWRVMSKKSYSFLCLWRKSMGTRQEQPVDNFTLLIPNLCFYLWEQFPLLHFYLHSYREIVGLHVPVSLICSFVIYCPAVNWQELVSLSKYLVYWLVMFFHHHKQCWLGKIWPPH